MTRLNQQISNWRNVEDCHWVVELREAFSPQGVSLDFHVNREEDVLVAWWSTVEGDVVQVVEVGDA